jgi:hypothetical protein
MRWILAAVAAVSLVGGGSAGAVGSLDSAG